LLIFFEIGAEYDRDELLHFTGSRLIQSGIIWGPKEPNCLIVTTGGKHATHAGYQDEKNTDGSWFYIGQGSEGDQFVQKKANALLVDGIRNILLFSTREPNVREVKTKGNRRKFYRYEGMFNALSWDFVSPSTGKRKGNQLIQVHLFPASNIYAQETMLIAGEHMNQPSLKKMKAEIQQLNQQKKARLTIVEYQYRSKLIKQYALGRANGTCELCGNEAPFLSSANNPFLEVHHILKLADDGPDSCENVAALCPNCHREAHFGKERSIILEKLKIIIQTKET
jgi:5-methylcytosine-specific restriction enzyme A